MRLHLPGGTITWLSPLYVWLAPSNTFDLVVTWPKEQPVRNGYIQCRFVAESRVSCASLELRLACAIGGSRCCQLPHASPAKSSPYRQSYRTQSANRGAGISRRYFMRDSDCPTQLFPCTTNYKPYERRTFWSPLLSFDVDTHFDTIDVHIVSAK